MRALREVYDFITGGSLAAPIGLACAIVAALLIPGAREAVFVAVIAATLVASALETPK